MLDICEPRRSALLACTVAKTRARVRDESVVMLSKRMARRVQEELADLEQRHKASIEQLLVAYRDVLTVLKDHFIASRKPRARQHRFHLPFNRKSHGGSCRKAPIWGEYDLPA